MEERHKPLTELASEEIGIEEDFLKRSHFSKSVIERDANNLTTCWQEEAQLREELCNGPSLFLQYELTSTHHTLCLLSDLAIDFIPFQWEVSCRKGLHKKPESWRGRKIQTVRGMQSLTTRCTFHFCLFSSKVKSSRYCSCLLNL